MSRGADALSIARGEVRDGAAAIEHFLQVLASRRVGPRVLARAVPEMAAGCVPLLAALTALADALTTELSEEDPAGLEAVHALLAYAEERVAQLSSALSAHGGAAMDARARLAVEAIVRRIAGELGEVVRLVDMLGAPVTSETVVIEFSDALSARRSASRPVAPPAAVVHATVEIRASELRVADARLVLQLLEHAVATVARAGVAAPAIVVESGPDGFPVFTVEEGQGAPPSAGRASHVGRVGHAGASHTSDLVFDATLREELPAAARVLDVMQAAARHAGLALTVLEGGRKVTIAV